MTIDYAALAERLEAHAECHSNVEPFDDEQRQWADDLRTVVSLLEEMAEAKPVAWMHDGPPLHGEASITPEPDAWHEFSLYAHPAPQPVPEGWQLVPKEPTPAMYEEGANQVIAPISTAGGKAAETYRAMLAVAPQPAPQPQPERQPVSEPTEAQIEQERSEQAKDAECFRLLKARMGAAIDAALAQAKDAERYRWLRGDLCPDHSVRWAQWEVRCWRAPFWTGDLRHGDLDAAIDAQIEQERSEQGKEGA